MKPFLSALTTAACILAGSIASASPAYLTTHNNTNVESNAFINGTIASPSPTKANSDHSVMWIVVRMSCYGHIQNGLCPATIKMATDTGTPIDLGNVTINVETGDILPKELHANGYHFIVNGPGEVTLTEG